MAMSKEEARKEAAGRLSRERILHDIAELCENPYPNIRLVPNERNIRCASCLILQSEIYGTLHLTMTLEDYPHRPPKITMDSKSVKHPNIYGDYICASILNTDEGYTPAYSLKSIAIQMLSFFSSNSVEQESGGRPVDLKSYAKGGCLTKNDVHLDYTCWQCGMKEMAPPAVPGYLPIGEPMTTSAKRISRRKKAHSPMLPSPSLAPPAPSTETQSSSLPTSTPLGLLPNDVLLPILTELCVDDLLSFARACPRVSKLVQCHDLIRQAELQCFVLKKTYRECELGIGIFAARGPPSSEFDLLSHEAFTTMRIRRAVHGLGFNHWLPLPLSRGHWRRVRGPGGRNVTEALKAIRGDGDVSRRASKAGGAVDHPVDVLMQLMTQVVVQLNDQLGERFAYAGRSTVSHASDRAIEAYFHLFHLLVCLAVEDPAVAARANSRVRSFYVDGKRSKADCPNLGMLVVAMLVADDASTVGDEAKRQGLLTAIIREAMVRNVVWLLDCARGAGLAGLSCLEADDQISEYRLKHSLQGSLTSYRLLMFMELFRQTARGCSPQQQRQQKSSSGAVPSLASIQDELFGRHGAPPPGAAAKLAAEARRLQSIDTWPAFMEAMGVPLPSKLQVCQALRGAVRESMARGYSRWALQTQEAAAVGLAHDPQGYDCAPAAVASMSKEQIDRIARRVAGQNPDFFPNKGRRRNRH